MVMERHDEIFAALAAPFDNRLVLQRQQQNQTFRYVQPYAIRNRLDEVLGAANWEDDSRPANDGTGAYLCHLTITLPDGRKVTKTGVGAPPASDKSRAHPAKTAASDAFKRAAEEFGIARYLKGPTPVYRKPQYTPAPEPTKAEKLIAWSERWGHTERLRDLSRSSHGVEPEGLTDEQAESLYQLLKVATRVSPKPEAKPATNENGNPRKFGWPKSGAALFAWCKNLEQAYQTAIIKHVTEHYGERSKFGWPWNMKEWSPQQVEQAALYVAGIVKDFPGYDGQFDDHLPDLTRLKGDIMGIATELCVAMGAQNPTSGEVVQCITMHSAEVAEMFGGECIGDWDSCQDVMLLKGVREALAKDLAEAREPSF